MEEEGLSSHGQQRADWEEGEGDLGNFERLWVGFWARVYLLPGPLVRWDLIERP